MLKVKITILKMTQKILKWTFWNFWEQGSAFYCVYPITKTIFQLFNSLKLLRTQSCDDCMIAAMLSSEQLKILSCKMDPEEGWKDHLMQLIDNFRDMRRFYISPYGSHGKITAFPSGRMGLNPDYTNYWLHDLGNLFIALESLTHVSWQSPYRISYWFNKPIAICLIVNTDFFLESIF